MSSPPTSPSPDDQESLDEKRFDEAHQDYIDQVVSDLSDLSREEFNEKYKEQIAKGYHLKR